MAAGTVITVLSNIPWAQVVDAAPKVAEGAGRLWEAMKTFRKSRAVPPDSARSSTSAQPTEAERVQAQIAALEGSVQELKDQMLASAAVIKELADQNARLVQRIEQARIHFLALATGGALSIAFLSVAFIYLWGSR